MLPPHLIKDVFANWAKRLFNAEIDSSFQRAQIFDGHLSKVVVKALGDLAAVKLRILANVLPTGAASTGPSGQAARDSLDPVEKQAVDDFQNAVENRRQATWQEFSERVARMRQKETLDEAKQLQKVGLGAVKQMAAKWGDLAEKIGPAVWSLSSSRVWGKTSVHFDFESTLELHYGIFIYDRSGRQLRRHDHYLGVLGIGPSTCMLSNSNECHQKVLSVGEFVQWHLAEYDKLMAVL